MISVYTQEFYLSSSLPMFLFSIRFDGIRYIYLFGIKIFFFSKWFFFVEGGGLNIFKRITVKFYFDEKHKRLSLQFDFPQSNIYSVTYMHKK